MDGTGSNLLAHREVLQSSGDRRHFLWSSTVRSYYSIAMTLFAGLRLLSQFLVEFTDWTTVVVLAIAMCLPALLIFRISESEAVQKAQMCVFMTCAQAYGVFIAVRLHPNNYSLFCISSTITFCVFELSSFGEWWITLLLILRQYTMWKLAAVLIGSEALTSTLPYFTLLAMSVIILYFSGMLKQWSQESTRLNEVIEEQHCSLRNILHAIPEGVAVVTETLEVPCYNAQIERMLNNVDEGVAQALKRMNCTEAEESIRAESIMLQVQALLNTPSKDCATLGVAQVDGKYYEWKGTKCVWGKMKACILIASDISPWLATREKLQKESDSKTGLLRFVSHELRTPTNAILNLVGHVLTAPNITEQQKSDLSVVVTSTRFLLSVVNDLLDFSRLVANRFSLVKQCFDIRKEVQETVQLMELQCAQKGLFLTTKVDELVPQVIFSDPNRVKQVLLNLLSNALKFTFQGGIRVICMMADANTLRISVKDTGMGIPAQKLAALCQAFATVEGTQRINPQGCGLGLYISNLLAPCLGLKPITISSKVNVGSEFSFGVSIYQEEVENVAGMRDHTTEQIEDERENESPVSSSCCTGGKGQPQCGYPDVLVVDDSEFNQLVLLKLLETNGVKADVASTGLRALSVIRDRSRRGHSYRLILMDVEMPEMDGLTATQEIRALELSGELKRRPKIIACSAHNSQEDYERCLQVGMDSYLEKPISNSKLLEVIEDLVFLA